VRNAHDFWGEFIGTFILVFFGCGGIAVTILFSSLTGLFQVAVVWGIGVSLAIYATRHLSCAHLNPAVSVAMVAAGRMSVKRLPTYLIAQLLGSIAAALLLYTIFSGSITQFEALNGILRGSPDSLKTVMIFSSFYPNPGSVPVAAIGVPAAFLAEMTGTFILVFLIFTLTDGCNLGRPDNSLAPLFIGLTVAMVIAVMAPLTQAALNPARDLGPRVIAYFMGWRGVAFPEQIGGYLAVYIIAPLAGAGLAAMFFSKLVRPLMDSKGTAERCDCRP
jgi:glycerol uptake facilitator protein